MTVSVIVANKGRKVASIEPNASLAEAVRLLAESLSAPRSSSALTAAWPASSPNATSCAYLPSVALPCSTNR